MNKFGEAVLKIVSAIPFGKVVSYGQVAVYVGVPRAARQVGWALRRLDGEDIPWWRVINNAGRISIKGNMFNDATKQKELLEREGVVVGNDFSVDINRYRFVATESQLIEMGLDAGYVEWLIVKFKSGY